MVQKAHGAYIKSTQTNHMFSRLNSPHLHHLHHLHHHHLNFIQLTITTSPTTSSTTSSITSSAISSTTFLACYITHYLCASYNHYRNITVNRHTGKRAALQSKQPSTNTATAYHTYPGKTPSTPSQPSQTTSQRGGLTRATDSLSTTTNTL
ncbi:hypothetical protein K504DRAFT_245912 [Pleomassaria siparia CBS 279.74]|uniref:Uncharacterized protein n=1 Tax=Pleomassaria siparia CBS 279.74 TaxID=1314801 RepID=A0A6G1KBP7_9PLEO|nr:hypothetical protein K504DRAFT_245912 [Pleomassaria siparia CBS 279.74]